MLKTLWATVRQGKVELLDSTDLPEGSRLLVTLLPDGDEDFGRNRVKHHWILFGITLMTIFMPMNIRRV
jgi:hypothetical protein